MDTPTLRVLVAEDDEVLRGLVADLLRDEGFVVLEAGDGLAALARARADRPDAVLLDLGLPWLGGLDVLERLRADPRTASVRVVVCSGGIDADMHTALGHPTLRVADIVEKPLDFGRVLAGLAEARP